MQNWIITAISMCTVFFLVSCVPDANKKCKDGQVLVNGTCVVKEQHIVEEPTPTLAPTIIPTLVPTIIPVPTIQPKLSCEAVPHNGTESRIAYSAATVTYGQSCSSIQQTQARTCNNGVWSAWSGSYTHLSCSVQAALACGTIASGAFELRTMYQAANVVDGKNCVSEIQNRKCTNGQLETWSGTYTQPKCVISRTRYESDIVQVVGACKSEQQLMTCENAICGVWTPSNYTFATCLLQTTPPNILSESPSISTVSGSINSGEILTITGIGFGLHADHNLKKDYLVAGWENFETGLADPIFNGNYGPELVTNTNVQKANSKYAAKGYNWETARPYTNVWGQSKNAKTMYGFYLSLPTLQKKIFMSGWFMFPEGFDTGISYHTEVIDQTKFMGMTPLGTKVVDGVGGYPGGKTYFATRRGATTIPIMTNTEDGHLGEGTTTPLFNYAPMGTWHRYDIYVDLNQPEGKKIHNWYVDGLKLSRIYQNYNIDAKLIQAGISDGFNYLSWLMFQFQGSDNQVWPQYMDDAFANLTQARIEISESPVWDENKQTHKEIQIPLSWADTKIMVKINKGAFSSNQDLYLYVITDDGKISAAKKIQNAF